MIKYFIPKNLVILMKIIYSKNSIIYQHVQNIKDIGSTSILLKEDFSSNSTLSTLLTPQLHYRQKGNIWVDTFSFKDQTFYVADFFLVFLWSSIQKDIRQTFCALTFLFCLRIYFLVSFSFAMFVFAKKYLLL